MTGVRQLYVTSYCYYDSILPAVWLHAARVIYSAHMTSTVARLPYRYIYLEIARCTSNNLAIKHTSKTENHITKSASILLYCHLYSTQSSVNIMKIIIPAFVLIATAFGIPAEVKRWDCTPGTYSCTGDEKGWQVCDVSGNWVVSNYEVR